MKLRWDEKVPEKTRRRYTRRWESLKSKKSITISKFAASTTVSEISLHAFVDASKDVVYATD